ncbi:Golgi-associated plant pathogenesis-related protein 1-like [Drosophila biarmipes]|uniref:Golgi-associated plant pathogenesis-related protein 1-like n=1 Tax=Drosophila biarmipes TaxID=125945 RepID=UPI001CDAFF38|nr:Golgi-associated plant pathogenesis-related protein 1-like [Drosophila biarmipes]
MQAHFKNYVLLHTEMYSYKIVVLLLAVFKLNCICLGDVVTAETVLKEHNEYRKVEGMPKLSLSKKLSEDCEEYAKHLATLKIPDQNLFEDIKEVSLGEIDEGDDAEDHTAYPSSDIKKVSYTENICEFKSKSCVGYWYERGQYGYQFEHFDLESEKSFIDKYTAMVWRSSKEMGVGIAPKNPETANGRKILVVRYSPPGNVYGQYKGAYYIPRLPRPWIATTHMSRSIANPRSRTKGQLRWR